MFYIYKIKNLKTGNCYIGRTVNVESRVKSHLSYLKRNNHQSVLMQQEYNDYGESVFVFGIICKCSSFTIATKKELKYIYDYKAKFNSLGNFYKIEKLKQITLTHKNFKLEVSEKTNRILTIEAIKKKKKCKNFMEEILETEAVKIKNRNKK